MEITNTNTNAYYIGTSGWNYEDWVGRFYPKGLAQAHWFEYYTKYFNSVEINATFYRSFPNKVYSRWYQQAPANFLYVIKLHKFITHHKHLRDVADSIARAETSAQLLQNKLGMMLLQLAPNTSYNLTLLRDAIKHFKHPQQLVIEFRDEKWWSKEICDLLKKLNVTVCLSDSPNSVCRDWLTGSNAYIRLHGRKEWYDYCYSKTELTEIAHLAKQLKNQGAEKIFIFFNNDVNAYAPKNALTLMGLF